MEKSHLEFLNFDAGGITAYERVYREIKSRILFGQFLPGKALTLRGLADNLSTGLMPVREAVRRLIAERALVMHSNRRVSIPEMNNASQGEIILARSLLEPEIALLAMKHLIKTDIKVLASIDAALDTCLANGDIKGYMRDNVEFHFFLYSRAGSSVLLGLVESLWLQFGPFIRLVYGRHGTLYSWMTSISGRLKLCRRETRQR